MGARSNAGEFVRRMEILTDHARKSDSRTVRAAAIAADAAVVTMSPVDTGRFRSNWIVSTGAPKFADRPPFMPGRKGSTAGENARRALEEANDAIARHRGGQAIYLQNNVPYAKHLNDGTSKQAPRGFVARGVRVAEQVARTSKILNPPGGDR